MKRLAVAVLAGAGCLTGPQQGSRGDYPVDAVALLEPLDLESPAIEGPIEILGIGMPGEVVGGGARTIAAYGVHLPDGVDALVALMSAASCTDRAPLIAPDDPVAVQDLGLIRRVGDETHFFARQVDLGDRVVDVDIETATAYVPRYARFPRIVIAASPVDFRVLACGELVWQ